MDNNDVIVRTMADLDSYSKNDQKMLLCFHGFNPNIARLPHCIFKASRPNLETVLGVVPDQPGWYGGDFVSYLHLVPDLWKSLRETYPDWDEYVDYIDGWQGWRMWALPEMQEILKEHDGCSCDNFTMVINVDTAETVLEKIHFDERSIPVVIDELRWVYMQLEPETKYTLFVTSSPHADWVREVMKKLLESNQEVVTLSEGEDRFYWHEHGVS